MKRKELFTVIGEVRIVDEKKRFVPNSPDHMHSKMTTLPMGKQIACTFSEHKATRSESQLAYHFVLVGYLADHTGHTKDEMHDAVMRMVFGTKFVEVAGRKSEVRRSISKSGSLNKAEVVELIDFDLELCAQEGIRVPTAEELGYVVEHPNRTRT